MRKLVGMALFCLIGVLFINCSSPVMDGDESEKTYIVEKVVLSGSSDTILYFKQAAKNVPGDISNPFTAFITNEIVFSDEDVLIFKNEEELQNQMNSFKEITDRTEFTDFSCTYIYSNNSIVVSIEKK